MNNNSIDWVEVPFEVPGDHAGARVDAYLARRLHRYSRAEVQRLIVSGRVTLRGNTVKSAARIGPGDRIVVRYPRREEPPPRHSSLEVLYEDDSLLAVSKPGDLLSHPTDKIVRGAATSILREQFGRRLHQVHRLDRETSGVLLLAKDPASARALTDAFTRREVSKEYLALVRGRAAFTTRDVELPIGREGRDIKVRQSVTKGGQPAATSFFRLAVGRGASLIAARPRTGRLHQIRVHLAALGHPVLGDKLYTEDGAAYRKAVRRTLSAEDTAALGAERQMLHAWRLRLAHPSTGRPIEFTALPPEDFVACGRAFGLDVKAVAR